MSENENAISFFRRLAEILSDKYEINETVDNIESVIMSYFDEITTVYADEFMEMVNGDLKEYYSAEKEKNEKCEYWTINPPFVINIIKYKYGLIKTETFASPDDWIVKDNDGQFHSCKPDIFEKTYEKKEENENA